MSRSSNSNTEKAEARRSGVQSGNVVRLCLKMIKERTGETTDRRDDASVGEGLLRRLEGLSGEASN